MSTEPEREKTVKQAPLAHRLAENASLSTIFTVVWHWGDRVSTDMLVTWVTVMLVNVVYDVLLKDVLWHRYKNRRQRSGMGA